jgi:hypothetical protein
MHTKDRLAAALREIGLTEMAHRATRGYYDDFLSELDMPAMQLIRDLTAAGKPARDLLKRAMEGEFDGSKEEAETWAESPEGQAVLRKFTL